MSEFRENCLHLLDGLPAEGILIAKRGRLIAKVTPVPCSCANLIGSLKDLTSDPEDDLLSTGVAWDVESGHSYSDQGTFEGSLTAHEQTVVTGDPEWSISAIVLWEITKSHQLGRLRYGLDHEGVRSALAQVHVWPITREVCLNLRALDVKSDPADEIIAATSLTHDLPPVTRDPRIRKSRAIRFV